MGLFLFLTEAGSPAANRRKAWFISKSLRYTEIGAKKKKREWSRGLSNAKKWTRDPEGGGGSARYIQLKKKKRTCSASYAPGRRENPSGSWVIVKKDCARGLNGREKTDRHEKRKRRGFALELCRSMRRPAASVAEMNRKAEEGGEIRRGRRLLLSRIQETRERGGGEKDLPKRSMPVNSGSVRFQGSEIAIGLPGICGAEDFNEEDKPLGGSPRRPR